MVVAELKSDLAFRWERGYSAPAHARPQLKEWHRTRLPVTVLTALSDHAVILGCGALGTWLFFNAPLLVAVLAWPLLAMIVARQQRGIENLVHEASHFNWCRDRRRINDTMANLFAALPVFSLVDRYRHNHLLHHNRFGTEEDSCLNRYERLNIEDLDRSSFARLIAGIGHRIYRYVLGWWEATQTSPKVLVAGLAWHLVFLVLPACLILGVPVGVGVWLAFWVAPFFLVLPWQRFLAEAAKHKYHDHGTVLEATVSNIGPIHRWLLHPHNDGYHLMHHLFPGIPHHQLERAHFGLKKLDPEGFSKLSKERHHLLEEPEEPHAA
jgi:fatty acid desaturase